MSDQAVSDGINATVQCLCGEDHPYPKQPSPIMWRYHCWVCETEMDADLWARAPREPDNEDHRWCLRCHNLVENHHRANELGELIRTLVRRLDAAALSSAVPEPQR